MKTLILLLLFIATSSFAQQGKESFQSKRLPWGGYWWSMRNGELVLGWDGSGKRAVWTPEEVRKFDSCLDSYSIDCVNFFKAALSHKEMSPLMKFDYYTRMRNERLKGPGGAFPNEYSHASIWELQNHYIGDNTEHRLYSNSGFAGKCIGWALATMFHDEPVKNKIMEGVEFTPADMKGILSVMYNAAQFFAMGDGMVVGNEFYEDSASNNTKEFLDDVSPRDTIDALRKTIKQGSIMEADLDPGHGVWNHPVYQYDLSWKKAGTQLKGTLVLHYATDIVGPEQVFSTSTQRPDFMQRTLEFSMSVSPHFNGDFSKEKDPGIWIGKSANEHPDTIILAIEENWRSEIYQFRGTMMKTDVNMPLFKRVKEGGKWVPLLDLLLTGYYSP